MRIGVLAVLCLALLTGEVHARKAWFNGGYCNASYGYSAGYYAPGYYEVYTPPVVLNVAAFLPYLAYQPVGVSTYQPAAPAAPLLAPNVVAPVAQGVVRAPADYCKEHTAALEKRITFMEQLMLNMSKGGQPDPQVQPMPQQGTPLPPGQAPMPPAQEPQGGVPPGLSVAVAKCATCHEKSVAQQKAKGVAFFDGGKMLKLDAPATIRWTRQLLAGKMPPKDAPQLTAEEMPAIMQMILEGK